MGVNKLWDILLTIAVQKNIEDLSGLILAIDASLWIVKVNSIFQNVDEGLKCIFNKILWLKKNNIKPIFVFDGDTPALKRRTLEERRNKRRQVDTLDITKKVEIEIVKTVTGTQSQKNQKQYTRNQYDQKSRQIDQMLNNLLKYQTSTNPIQLSEKISLQGQVLNKKYELYIEICPKILQKYGNIQYFESLDIQSKQQILQTVQQNDLPTGREIKRIKQCMSQQEKIMYQMQLIKKKSKILQLQDNLYRKVMTKKVENGFEIIEGVYNGKKVIQKRKIKQKTFDQWGFNYAKKDTCNNFKQIFNKNKNKQESQSQVQQYDDKTDFFSNIFNRDYKKQRQTSSQSTFQQISQRLSTSSQQILNKNNQTNHRKGNQKKPKQTIISSQQERNSEQEYFNDYKDLFDVQQKPKLNSQNIRQQNDPDEFPDYLIVQKLDQMCTSNNNLHLQNMLDILGINYIIAPYEAEAQCATLEQMGLVDAVVTQDSDVFLFGSRKVYRGVFQDNIKLYSMNKIEQKLLLTRQKMILFALMLGSDYTQGIKGIGIVNAMQILKVHHDIQSLEQFTNWAKSADLLLQSQQNKTDYMLQNAMSQDQRQFYKMHRKFKNYWHINPNFPQHNIYNAYMEPAVQTSEQLQKKIKQKKKIHIDALKKLMEDKFKIVPAQIELNLRVFTKKFQRKTQPQITQFIPQNLAKIVSKRLKRAINIRDLNQRQ